MTLIERIAQYSGYDDEIKRVTRKSMQLQLQVIELQNGQAGQLDPVYRDHTKMVILNQQRLQSEMKAYGEKVDLFKLLLHRFEVKDESDAAAKSYCQMVEKKIDAIIQRIAPDIPGYISLRINRVNRASEIGKQIYDRIVQSIDEQQKQLDHLLDTLKQKDSPVHQEWSRNAEASIQKLNEFKEQLVRDYPKYQQSLLDRQLAQQSAARQPAHATPLNAEQVKALRDGEPSELNESKNNPQSPLARE